MNNSGYIMTKKSLSAGNSASRRLAFCLLFLLMHWGLYGSADFCFNRQESKPKIKIVTSVFPLMEFARAVAAERGDVSILLPPGAEVHTWQPRPSDILKLGAADLFVYIGEDLEPWAQSILKSLKNPSLRILEVSREMTMLIEDEALQGDKHKKTGVDPHVWLDFGFDEIIVDKISEKLSETDPDSAEYFQFNASRCKEKLRALDHTFKEELAKCSQKNFVVGGHAAFGYLARRYNLHQQAVFGLSPDSRPKPKQLAETVRLAAKYKVKVIYFEKSIGDKLAKVIAKEIGAKTLILNPGANLSRAEIKAGVTFFDIMKANLENLKVGLSCKE